MNSAISIQLAIAFRGEKVLVDLDSAFTVAQVKEALIERTSTTNTSHELLQPTDIKLLFKGKVLQDDQEDLYDRLSKEKPSSSSSSSSKPVVFRLVASGVSSQQKQALDEEIQSKLQSQRSLVRDDLTDAGRREQERRRILGLQTLQKSAAKQKAQGVHSAAAADSKFGFGQIRTLPNLPDEAQAHEILTKLANDPGILACMKLHAWHVGSLSELYPEGKVGESEVCLMGLNKNKGQEILLRLRTDDLKGFRKELSIRQVLYHELAHNVHGEHDGKFFQLMRQIEQECTTLDWTGGAGLTNLEVPSFEGGTYRLGGGSAAENRHPQQQQQQHLPPPSESVSIRELAARAALGRWSDSKDQKSTQSCSCDSHHSCSAQQQAHEGRAKYGGQTEQQQQQQQQNDGWKGKDRDYSDDPMDTSSQ